MKILKTFLSYPSIRELIAQVKNTFKYQSIVKTIQSLVQNNKKNAFGSLVDLTKQEISKPSLYQTSQPDYIKMLRLSYLFSARITMLGDTKITFGPEFKHSKLWAGFINDERNRMFIRIKDPKYKDIKTNFDPKQLNLNTLVTCKIKNYRESLITKKHKYMKLICGCKESAESFIHKGCLLLQDYVCQRHGAYLNALEVEMVERSLYCDLNKCGKCGSIIGDLMKCSKCKLSFCSSECAQKEEHRFKISGKKIKCPRCKNNINAAEESCWIEIKKLDIEIHQQLAKSTTFDLLNSSIDMSSCNKCKLFKASRNNLCKSCDISKGLKDKD